MKWKQKKKNDEKKRPIKGELRREKDLLYERYKNYPKKTEWRIYLAMNLYHLMIAQE